MAVLFLDPLVLGLLAAVLVYLWLVGRGHWQAWFGRDGWWPALAWPGPLVAVIVLVVGSSISEMVATLDGGSSSATVWTGLIYLAVYGVPLVGLTVAPPRWLFPGWARSRIAEPPAPQTGRISAVNAGSARGHGALSRWAWRVDGTPGYLEVIDGELRFRASAQVGPFEVDELEDDAVDQLALSLDDELRLRPPRGGWWTRRHTDVRLDEVDRLSRTATRRRDGVVVIEVEDRRPLHLWVADLAALDREMAEPRPSGAGPRGDGGI